ncbi:MAG: hypothetical protein RRY12_11815, partial [Cloacibacillus sp.]
LAVVDMADGAYVKMGLITLKMLFCHTKIPPCIWFYVSYARWGSYSLKWQKAGGCLPLCSHIKRDPEIRAGSLQRYVKAL